MTPETVRGVGEPVYQAGYCTGRPGSNGVEFAGAQARNARWPCSPQQCQGVALKGQALAAGKSAHYILALIGVG